jgi:hypothetical protein
MNKRNAFLLLGSHAVAAAAGFAGGIYVLPVLVAPPAPSVAEVKASDALHWGEGVVSIGSSSISLMGELAPGPDYKLYLSPEFVETESDFKRLRSRMVRVGDVKTFENFVVTVPSGVDPSQFSAVIIWCETFSEFITAAKYR